MGVVHRVFGVDPRCPTPNTFSGATCKRRGCPHCGRPWAFSQGAVMRLNFEHYAGDVVLISVTAPGASRLPWACDRDHVHSGPRGCRVDAQYADAWSEDCSLRLRALRDAAKRVVRTAGFPVASLWLGRVWEPQKRGVPHAHIVAGAGTPREYEAAMRFHAELVRLAPDYGFGRELHVTQRMAPREASRYLVGYLLGRSGKKETVRENIADPRMPRLIVYVARSLTRETLVTMRRLRYARWYFAALGKKLSAYPRAFGDDLFELARVCAQLEREHGPPDEPVTRVTTRRQTSAPLTFEVPTRVVENLRVMRRLAVAA